MNRFQQIQQWDDITLARVTWHDVFRLKPDLTESSSQPLTSLGSRLSADANNGGTTIIMFSDHPATHQH